MCLVIFKTLDIKLYMAVYLVSRTSVTKYHEWGGLNKRNLSSHHSAICKSKIKVLAGLVSFSAFPGFADGHLLSVSSRGHPSVHVHS